MMNQLQLLGNKLRPLTSYLLTYCTHTACLNLRSYTSSKPVKIEKSAGHQGHVARLSNTLYHLWYRTPNITSDIPNFYLAIKIRSRQEFFVSCDFREKSYIWHCVCVTITVFFFFLKHSHNTFIILRNKQEADNYILRLLNTPSVCVLTAIKWAQVKVGVTLWNSLTIITIYMEFYSLLFTLLYH